MNVEQEIINAIDNNIIYGYKGKWVKVRKEKLEYLSKLNVSLPQQGSEEDNLGKLAFSELSKEGIETGKRAKLRITRFLNRKLGLNFVLPDQVIETITNILIKNLFKIEIKIRIDKGAQITKNYKEAVGGGSCMTGDCSEYTKIYEMNPDRFEQIVVNYIHDSARAILCTLDNGEKSCERIYGTSQLVRDAIKEYALENRWWDINVYSKVMTGLKYEDGHVPYFDGFYYHKKVKDKLNIFTKRDNENGSSRSYDGDLGSTGGYLYPGSETCCNCENHGELQTIQGDLYCDSCVDDLFMYCDSCCSYEDINNAQNVGTEWYCGVCVSLYAFECGECGDTFHNDDNNELEGDDLCPDCYAEKATTCTGCETIVYFSNITDGLCEECVKVEELQDERV